VQRIFTLVFSGALCLLIAQPAGAATTTPSSRVHLDHHMLTFTAAPNVANDVSIEQGATGRKYLVTDAVGIQAGTGCVAVSETSVLCTGDASFVDVFVRDLADRVSIATINSGFITIEGGGGNDTITSRSAADLIGGGGNDSLTGSNFRDGLSGGTGNDQLNAMAGTDYLSGGLGVDSIDGGNGPDIATYSERLEDVHISSDGIADDGAPGEGDNVINAEYLMGGQGNDTIVTSSVAAGNGGNDDLSFSAGASGTLSGGAGNDTLTAGSAFSFLRGQQGDDTLMSMNGHGDSDICNSGTDSVNADATDSVAADCEHITT
jgi:Ca2+-binding RTX toxin-like protein